MRAKPKVSNQLPPFEVRKRRGCFIAFDGLDGSGLSTQVDLLCRWLAEKEVPYHKTKEPSSGPFGAQIRLSLAKRLELDELTIALAFAADRADHLHKEIMPALEGGLTVVSDRYILSSYAYQAPHVDSPWFENVNSYFPLPDLTIFLDVPPRICMRRMEETRWHLEKNEKLADLIYVYEHFHLAVERLRAKGARVAVIKHSDDRNEVFEQVLNSVCALPFPLKDQLELEVSEK
jgi:dTMP kinase